MQKKSLKRRVITAVCALLIVAVFFSFIVFSTLLLTPERGAYGCIWEMYLCEPKKSLDVMFFGTSQTYCDIMPGIIYQKAGIKSFVLAGPTQNMTESYYYIKEALKTQSPKIIFLEVTGLLLTKYDEYDILNIGYMPMNENRVGATLNAIDAKDWYKYFFPLSVYHSRWNEVTFDDVKNVFTPKGTDILAGYTYIKDSKPFPNIETRTPEYTESEFNRNERYFCSIADLCREKGIRLITYFSPSRFLPDSENATRLAGAIEKAGVEYIDFNADSDKMGIDPMTDFFDRAHLCCSGAKKFTAYLADYLSAELVVFGESDPMWEERAEYTENL